MCRKTLAISILALFAMQANAQISVMKLVGNGTKDYSIGFGAFLKVGYPVTETADITLEVAADIFLLKNSGSSYGTAMCPIKAGYKYFFNGNGEGFYVEPQLGYNIYGVTSLPGDDGHAINLEYHGIVLAAATGYLFMAGRAGFDVNLRYETVIAHGGSNNFISLGISRYFSFKKRDTDY